MSNFLAYMRRRLSSRPRNSVFWEPGRDSNGLAEKLGQEESVSCDGPNEVGADGFWAF